MSSLVTILYNSTAQEIVNWVTTADGCVHTADATQHVDSVVLNVFRCMSPWLMTKGSQWPIRPRLAMQICIYFTQQTAFTRCVYYWYCWTSRNHSYLVWRCPYKPLTQSVVWISVLIISRWFDDSCRCRQLTGSSVTTRYKVITRVQKNWSNCNCQHTPHILWTVHVLHECCIKQLFS